MSGRLRACRVVVTSTGMVISKVLVCAVGAVLPTTAGAILFMVGLAVMGVLLTGRAESAAVRLLAHAREPHEFEMAGLRPAVLVLAQHGMIPPGINVLVRPSGLRLQADAAGRSTVIVSEGLAARCAQGGLRPETAAALLAHAIARVRLGETRFDVATEFWMLPWRAVQAVARTLAQVVGWFPLTALAWRVRAVVGAVALIQGFLEGRPFVGVASAAVVTLTYVLPWCERQAQRLAVDEADRVVMEAGLGTELAAHLAGGPATSRRLARIHRLRGPAGGPRLAAVAS